MGPLRRDEEPPLPDVAQVAEIRPHVGRRLPADELPVGCGAPEQHPCKIRGEETGRLAMRVAEGVLDREPEPTAEPPDVGEILLQQLGMVLWQPRGQEIEPPSPANGADVSAPGAPPVDQALPAEQADDLRVRRVFDETDGGPVTVQPADGARSGEECAKGLLVDVVVPDLREPPPRLHTLLGHDESPRDRATSALPP